MKIARRLNWRPGYFCVIITRMATKLIPVYIDDLTGQEVKEIATVPFGLDGIPYEIDLSPESKEQLRASLAPYLAAARRISRTNGTQISRMLGTAPTRSDRAQLAKIREWWGTNFKAAGLSAPTSNRGRIPGAVTEAYEKHGGLAVPAPEPVKPAKTANPRRSTKAAAQEPAAPAAEFSAS